MNRTERTFSINKRIRITTDDFLFQKEGEMRKFEMGGKDLMGMLSGVKRVTIQITGDGAAATLDYTVEEPIRDG